MGSFLFSMITSGLYGMLRLLHFWQLKDITIGPTAIMALMTQVHAQYRPDYAVLLSSLAHHSSLWDSTTGFLIDTSVPVDCWLHQCGYPLSSGQVRSPTGLKLRPQFAPSLRGSSTDGSTFFAVHLSIRWEDAVLGVVCSNFCFLEGIESNELDLRALMNPQRSASTSTKCLPLLRKSLSNGVCSHLYCWNAVVVVICAVMAGFSPTRAASISWKHKSGKLHRQRYVCLETNR